MFRFSIEIGQTNVNYIIVNELLINQSQPFLIFTVLNSL